MTPEAYSSWKFWFDIIQFILTGAVGVYVWLTARDRVTQDRIEKVETATRKKIELVESELDSDVGDLAKSSAQQFADIEKRLAKVESACITAPQHADLGAIHDRINTVAESLATLAGETRNMGKTLTLVHEYLLEEGKNR